jgi:hypothetical protein
LVDAQTIGVLVTAASVTVAAVYYMFTLRTNQRNYKATLDTRQAQLFMQLFDRFTSSEFALNYGKARYEILPKLNNSPEELSKFIYQNTNEKFNSEVFLPFHQLSVFFEGVGVLVQKDLINIDLVERLFSDRIIWFWTMIKPRIIFSRESQGPQLYENMEWLYNEMVRRQGKLAAQ